MNKLLVITFNNEEDAYEGLNALKELDKKGDISLYASAVLFKDAKGNVVVRQADDKGPLATVVGMITGALVGTLGGPVGMAIGTTAGGVSGSLLDIGEAGINVNFIEEVSLLLNPEITVVIADIEEEWVTPVDTKIAQFDGQVFRRLKAEVVENQLAADSEAFERESKAKINAFKTKVKNAKDTQKAKFEKKITEIKADKKIRSEKLQNSVKLAKEALRP